MDFISAPELGIQIVLGWNIEEKKKMLANNLLCAWSILKFI